MEYPTDSNNHSPGFEEFFLLALDLLCVADEQGNFIKVNEAWELTLGFSRQELEQMKFLDLVHPEDLKPTLDAMAILRKQKPLLNFVNRYRHKDGSYRHIEWRSNPHGRLYYAAARDITDRIEAMQREKHLNSLLLAIRNVNQIITQETDATALIRRSTDALMKTLGFYNTWIILLDKEGGFSQLSEAGLKDEIRDLEKTLNQGHYPQCVKNALKQSGAVIDDNPASNCFCPMAIRNVAHAGISCRISYGETIFGVIIASAPEEFASLMEVQSLFSELADDLGYALNKIEIEAIRLQTERDLRERNKELACYSAIAQQMIQVQNTKEFCSTVNLLLETAMQYPEDAVAELTLDEESICNKKQNKTLNFLQATIAGTNLNYGRLKVYYPPGKQFMLPEEQNLVNHVGYLVGLWYQNKKVSEQLNQSEEDLRITLHSIGDGMIATDMQGRVNRMNPVAEQLTGWTLSEAFNKPLEDVFPIVNAFSREKVENPVQKVLAKGKIVGLANHTILIGRDGSESQIADSAAPIVDDMGRTRGVILVFSDVSEKYAAEERIRENEILFRTLVENAFDGIYLMRDQKFEYVNERFSQILGRKPEDITSEGFNIYSVLTANSKGIVEKRFRDRQKGLSIPPVYEMEVVIPSGEVRAVELNTIVLEDGASRNRILGVMRDITYRKRQQSLEQEVEIAKQSVRFKQNFLANMSHEIRTPITGIMGITEAISKTPLSETQTEYLSILKLSTDNLREIINQILDYSKIEAGQMKIRARALSPATLLENARKVFDSICNKEVVFHTSLGKGLPVCLEADEQRISQVINNFLSNAVKFTDKGEITLRIFSEEENPGETLMVKVEMEDSGPGINPLLHDQLFQPFSQLEQADLRLIEGTGLGLSISKKLAGMMGGNIGLRSKPGQGSTFWFTFKARAMERVQLPCSEVVKPMDVSGRNLRILLVEDKLVNQKVISLMLNSLGHVVTTANNGQQAIDKFIPGAFELILMDIQMPVMDGITATQTLKKTHAVLPPIVGLSANAFEGDREKYMNLGMDEYITKPVQSEDFVLFLKSLFSNGKS